MIRIAARRPSRARSLAESARRRRQARRGFQFESLESRWLMHGDDLIGDEGPALSSVQDWMAPTGSTSPSTSAAQEIADQAEGEDAPDLVAFAKGLAAAGVKFFGADWCPFCNQQKALFEDGAKFLPFIEVTNPDHSINQVGIDNNITTFPTWQFPDNSRATGVVTLAELSQRSGVAIPASSNPFIAPIDDITLLAGSPRNIPIDGYDPNGGALTYTVTISNPSVVTASIPQGNSSLKMSVTNFGDMVFQLFEDKAPVPSGRIIQLAQSGFFDAANNSTPMVFHRVISNFVIQTGDPTGTGSGGSSLADFDDQYHPDLQHNQSGVLSYAKTSDDTNDSQLFITASPQRLLDFNHSIFGQLVEGDSVRAAVNRTSTNSSNRPTRDVKINTVSVFDDVENSLVFLKATGASGESDVTIRVTDQQGNTFTEVFHVTVAADTFNSAPFLSPIPEVKTTVNTPVSFQLQATDIEGSATFFDGVVGGGTSFNFTVDNSTGVVNITPPTGFTGTLELFVGVRGAVAADTVDQFDTQRVSIAVAPAAPTSIDLLAESDSGSSSTDNITKTTATKIVVNGVTSGAQVTVMAGTVVLGQTTSTGTSATVDANLALLADGTHTITATQRLNNQTSTASPALQVKLDRQLPTFLSAAPSLTQVNQRLLYNAITPDEAAGDVRYSLVTPPSGAIIDPVTGVLDWTPTAAQLGVHSFAIEAVDAAGNVRRQEVQLAVEGEQSVSYRLQTRKLNGTLGEAFNVGEEFFLDVFVKDIRAVPKGVVSAFVDVLFTSNKVSVVGNLQFGTRFDQQQNGVVGSAAIDEAGGVSALTETGGTEQLLFTARFRANQAGQVVFESNTADSLPLHDTLLVDQTAAVPTNRILYGTADIDVSLAFTVVNDVFNIDEDTVSELDVKANDSFTGSSTGALRVSAVGTASQGGQVSVATNGNVRYQPAAHFNGLETFTYTLTDDVSGSSQATVTVQVQPKNDPPTANNDALTGTQGIQEDSQQILVNVLANDTVSPDVGETLRVTAVGQTSNSGVVTIAANGTNVFYTPFPNFFGNETFTYTISDGNGGTATGTVTVEVKSVNDPPRVQSDSFNLNEDSAATQLDPLANDSSGVDAAETLTITTIQRSGNGTGTATLTSDGKKVVYTPAANFFGEEAFTYTVSDGNGGTAQNTIRFVVAAQNDNPTALNDTAAARFTVTKNTMANRLEVLRNDAFAPDSGETLTVTSKTNATAGGTLQISTDGRALLYTPVANFVGTDTFSYTISDGNGGTATANVEVEVRNFIPSTIGGFVYIDSNNNAAFDANEQPLGGVKVIMQGQDQFGTTVNVTQTTAVNGSYQFTNVAPGNYSLREAQPEFFQDGLDKAGSQGGTAGNDVITIALPENVNATNYNFGEVGRQAPFVGVRDLFASNKRPQLLLVVDPTSSLAAYAANSSWSSVHSPAVSLSSDQRTWNVTVQNGQQSQLLAAFPNRYSSALQVLGTRAGKTLLRIVGRLNELPFQTVQSGLAPSGEGEGERENAINAIAQHAAATSSTSGSASTPAALVDSVMAQWTDSTASAASTALTDFSQLFVSSRKK